MHTSNVRLPAEYQEVEYIESSGTQWIDISAKFSWKTDIDLSIAFTSARSGWSGIIGAQTNNVVKSYCIGIDASNVTFQNTITSNIQRWVDFSFTPTLNQVYNITTDFNKIYVDGTLKATTANDPIEYTTEYNARLFSVYQYSGGGFPYNISARIYSCKIYDNGNLIRDYVPCYRKQDTEIGMYDLVNDVFYTNAGSGVFAKGADIPSTTEHLVRPSGGGGWQPGANTLAYRPLSSDLNDYSGNNHNFSATVGTYSFSDNMCTLQRATISGWSLNGLSSDFTINMWTSGFGPNSAFMFSVDNMGYPSGQMYWGGPGTDVGFNMIYNNNFYGAYKTSYGGVGVHLFTGIKTATTITLYIDGVQQDQTTGTFGTFTGHNNTWLGRNVNGSGTSTCGEIIIEDKARTAQEIVDYYNQTKANYGIS